MAASSRTMPARLRSMQGNGCSVLFPHKTQFQILVHASVRIYVTAGSLPAGEPGKCSCGVLQLLQHRRHATWRVWPVWHMSQAKADSHHHHCHPRKCCHHFPHCPELESGTSPGLCCFLTVCPPANHLSPWGSVCSSVIWGCGDVSQIHLQAVMKVKVRE